MRPYDRLNQSIASCPESLWYFLIIAMGYLALTTPLSSVRSC